MVLGHVLVVQRRSRRYRRLQREVMDRMRLHAATNDAVLERVADTWLQNQAVNQSWLPDALERALYANCLKIIFRLLDLLAVSTRITLCGHSLQLQLTPCNSSSSSIEDSDTTMTFSDGASSTVSLDMDYLQAIARQMVEQQQQYPRSNLRPYRWWQFWRRMSHDFWMHVHVTVYALVLGLVQDVLQQAEITFLSDRIRLALVVPDGELVVDDGDMKEGRNTVGLETSNTQSNPNSLHKQQKEYTLVPWLLGILIGMAIRQIMISMHCCGMPFQAFRGSL